MNISLNWLKEYVDINVDYPTLEKLFNLKSSEVSRLEKLVDATNLTIGYVKTCEDHPDSDHLHVCQVDVGTEVLQIICGAPNVASGQKVIVALDGAVLPGNFKIKKSKIRGIESNGMICSLDELGIEKKYHNEPGIHILPEDSVIGSDPLEVLHYNDSVLELDLTPNRSDLLSLIGVAYDVKAISNSKLHLPEIKVHETDEEIDATVFTETKGCKSYYARVVKNVVIKDSPLWLKARLIASGIRPINNVVDISNYVMIEYGQPLHFFDYDQLKTKRIVVRDAIENEQIQTLDGQMRTLVKEDIVITDGEKPVALAGVMGGMNSEVESSTTSILIESAVFDPIRIRKTSKRLDLRSEASVRFERGLDPKRSLSALNRAAMLLELYASGKTMKNISYFDTFSYDKVTVKLSLDKISSVIGRNYSVEEIAGVFDRLSFEYKESQDVFQVTLPTRRTDLATAQDLIEEIVRIHGYDQVGSTYPETPTVGGLTEKQKTRRKIRNYLASIGLEETVTYSLVSSQKVKKFNISPTTEVTLAHPMTEERSTLRHSILDSMLDVVVYNLSRKVERVQLFEIGRVYSFETEREVVSGYLSGDFQSSPWQKNLSPVDFYLVKGIITSLCEQIELDRIEFRRFENTPSFLHPGQSAEVLSRKQVIGYLGRLHPALEAEYGVKDGYVFELDFDKLCEHKKSVVVVEPVAKYPQVSRDLALLVNEDISTQAIIDVITRAVPKKLIKVDLFDLYVGDKIDSNKKSMAFNLVFQDKEKTLSTEEVDAFITKILNQLETKLQVTLRN